MNVSLLGAELAWMLPLDAHELQTLLRDLHAAGSRLRPLPDVELLLVRDAEMATYNAHFMHCVGPTNILSFPADADSTEPAGGLPSHASAPASLLLSTDTLRREARLYGQRSGHCLLRLLAHGLGHVSGLDHGPEMDVFCDTLVKLHIKFVTALENRPVMPRRACLS